MLQHYYAMILAGGGGTRMWPMSRKSMPKQLLPLIDDVSMFRMSVERLAPLFTPDRIYVVAGPEYVELMRKDVPELPAGNFIVEPYGRDNSAATGLGISVVYKRDPHATIAMLTADHHIGKKEVFRSVLESAYEIAQQDHIVTLGISPSYPATGFGYIRQGQTPKTVNEFTYYDALKFTEKPDAMTAAQFVASGEYSWNSGMFIWKASKALQEFERQQPITYTLLEKIMAVVDTPEFDSTLTALWGEMPKISIDYAIMEKAEGMSVIPVDIGWSDVGSWASMFEVITLDENGNGNRGDLSNRIMVDTHKSLIVSERMTVTIGVTDLVIVETPDVLFICHRDRAQDVKDVVRNLQEMGLSHYL
jgi:mannose-1-phosphate guanylyltransferase